MKQRNLPADDSHWSQLEALVTSIPRTLIPCGRVHGLVIDEDALRVIENVQVQFVSAAGSPFAITSSRRYFDLQPLDTAIVVRVQRKDSVLFELPMTNQLFGKSQGYRMTVMLNDRGGRVLVESGSCTEQ